jgi:hypothetical protein
MTYNLQSYDDKNKLMDCNIVEGGNNGYANEFCERIYRELSW